MAQHQQHAVSLACKLVKELHGDIVERVARQMSAKGLQALPDIIRCTSLPESQVRQALLLLIQHNYVSAYLQKGDPGVKNARPPYSLYEPHLEKMLQIIRHPRFLLHIHDEMGEEAEQIVDILLQMGRLSIDEVVAAVAGRQGKEPAEVSERVHSVFMSLVQSHYLERAPPCFLPPPNVAPHPESVKGRRGAAKSGSSQASQEQARALRSLEEQGYEKQRFRIPLNVVLSSDANAGVVKREDGLDNNSPNGGSMKRKTGPGALDEDPLVPVVKKQRVRVGSKAAAAEAVKSADAPGSGGKGGSGAKGGGTRISAAQRAAAESYRREAEAEASAAAASRDPTTVLWRVNAEEFNRRFRHKSCVDMVKEKIDTDAANVLAAMLVAARPFEHELKEERSAPLCTGEVAKTMQRLVESDSLAPLSDGDVPTVIHTIAHDALELISYIGNGPDGDEQYVVNLGRIVELVKLKQVEAVIRDRFGASGLRIFRLLLLRGQLEQKQVTDFSMLSPKDTRELLYRMLRGGFLALQDIPRTSDRAPSRTFYTWRANYEGASGQLAGELYAAAARVWTRARHEMDREKELMELIEESRKKGEMHFTLTGAQRLTLQRLKKVTDALESSLLQLDEMIMIFNEF